jgi:hypothetical protein
MSSDNGSQSNPFAEMEEIINKKYIHLMNKRIELSNKKMNKAPQEEIDLLQISIQQLQEDFEGITKTHTAYLNVAKKFNHGGGKTATTKDTQNEFHQLLEKMKSSTMGNIVSGVPKQ